MHFYSRDKLLQEIASFGKKSAEARQISNRLKKFLPERLSELKKKYKDSSFRGAKSTRLALRDKDYRSFIKEYLDLKEEAHKNRIQWETHRMYFYARKTSR